MRALTNRADDAPDRERARRSGRQRDHAWKLLHPKPVHSHWRSFIRHHPAAALIFALAFVSLGSATLAAKDEGIEASLDRDKVIPAMPSLREAADNLEGIVPHDVWPLPNYREMLFVK